MAVPVSSNDVNININQLDCGTFTGAMLYVPKAHRADVLALDQPAAAAFAAYITQEGPKGIKSESPAPAATMVLDAAVRESAAMALDHPSATGSTESFDADEASAAGRQAHRPAGGGAGTTLLR